MTSPEGCGSRSDHQEEPDPTLKKSRIRLFLPPLKLVISCNSCGSDHREEPDPDPPSWRAGSDHREEPDPTLKEIQIQLLLREEPELTLMESRVRLFLPSLKLVISCDGCVSVSDHRETPDPDPTLKEIQIRLFFSPLTNLSFPCDA